MRTRPATLAVTALATLALAFLPRESLAYPTVEGQPAKYVIITGDALVASFQPLADWKTQTGLPAVVRSMSQVIAAHPVAIDDAERVRLEIRDAWQSGAEWVLLGGGTGVVPRRYAHTTFFGGKDLLTDLYFQCLDGNWDADGDHVYGEGFISTLDPGDSADLTPDVWLGRAPVQTSAEADRFVAKTLQYERTPAGDYEHRSLECAEVLFPQNWTPGDPTSLDGADLVEPLLPYFDLHPSLEVTRLYENFSNPAWRPGALPETPGAVLDSMRAGTNQTLIVATGGIHDVSVGPGTIGESDFLALTNGSRLQSLRFLGSSAAQFDSGGIARAALLAPGGGAASAIGASDFTFPTAARFEMTEYYRLIYQDGVNAQGEANARSILPFLPFTNFDGVNRWTVMTQLLLGDPELRTWTGPPRTLTVAHGRPPFVGETSYAVTVSDAAGPVAGARVCAWFPGDFLGVAVTDTAGAASIPIHPTRHGHFTLTVTADDARPFEERLPVAGPMVPKHSWPAGATQPEAPSLAVRVRGPQPVAGAPEVELVLGSAAPASVELLDLAGRRIAAREVAALGAGPHTVRLDEAAALAPGLYWLTLAQEGRIARTRLLVLR
jgi:peptidase C25-like protein